MLNSLNKRLGKGTLSRQWMLIGFAPSDRANVTGPHARYGVPFAARTKS